MSFFGILKRHLKAMSDAQEAGRSVRELEEVQDFAFQNGITWLFYNQIRDEWNGSDGELYTTSAIVRSFE